MKKRIAIVSTAMKMGGVEKALVELLKNLDYHRLEINLWLAEPGGDLEQLVPANVKIAYWGETGTRKQLGDSLKEGRIFAVAKGVWYRMLTRMWCCEWNHNNVYAVRGLPLCDEGEYDVVIAYQGISIAILATALYRFKAKSRIAWIHGAGPLAQASPHHRYLSRVYGLFDYVFCVSEAVRDLFCNRIRRMEHKTSVLHNLIDIEDIFTHAELSVEALCSVALVTVGRLSYEKGQDMVPRAVKLLLDAGYDVYWYLVGDGPLKEKILHEAERDGVADRVILLGTRMNPYPYIKNCDIYVQPSFSEGYCTTTMEAKILPKPIVTTNAPGMQEQFVSGENGLIVDAMTPEALAEGVAMLLEHPELRDKFIDNLKKESFDNLEELQKLYDFIES